MPLSRKVTAEFIGTFWLVFGGCGSAVLAAAFPNTGIGFLGVALAFGLTVLTMAYAIGHVSGCHLNPAVSVGLAVGKRFPVSELPAYIAAQVAGAIAAAAVLYTIASGKAGFDLAGGFAANGYAAHSPGGVLVRRVPGCRSGVDVHVSHDYPGSHRQPCAAGFRSDRHRLGFDPDSPDRDSGNEYVGESRAQHGPGLVRRRLGFAATLAVLAGADFRGRYSGVRLPCGSGRAEVGGEGRRTPGVRFGRRESRCSLVNSGKARTC